MAQDGEKVVLYVYDLSQGLARQLSTSLLGKAIEGIWHTGVGVFGNEYFFGGGIQTVPIGQSPYGRPVQVAELGRTQVPKEIFEEYLREIQPRYTQETYSLMRHNCNNFSDEVSQFLVGAGIPEHIVRLPEEVMNSPMGALLMPMIQNLETTLRYGGVPGVPKPTALSQPMPNFSNIQLPSGWPSPIAPSRSTRPASDEGQLSSGLFPRPSPPSVVTVANIPPTVSAARVPPQDALKLSANSVNNSTANKLEDGDDKGEITGQQSGGPATAAKESLSNTRAKVQEEITQEFAAIMASGSLRASEAAALAARKVLQRHGIGGGVTTSQG